MKGAIVRVRILGVTIMNDLGCSCLIDDWEADGGQWGFNEKIVSARKHHRCCECGEAIQVGELHEVASGNNDGGWWRQRTCLPCSRVRKAYCCTWTYGNLREAILQVLDFDYTTIED